MRVLYHFWLSPPCRAVRIALLEKRADFDLREETVQARRDEFLAINPAGEVPVLVESNGAAIAGAGPICEFLDEMILDPPLIGAKPIERAETRRLVEWFGVKFNREVTGNLAGEKITKRLLGLGEPDSRAIRAGHANLHHHLEYIAYLIERRNWIGGGHLSLADITAAAHLSCLDYLGDVPWEDHGAAKDWYARIKSRPSFRPLLKDNLPGIPPAKHYADLDF